MPISASYSRNDHVLVRQGLSHCWSEKFQVVAEASDGQDAVRLTKVHIRICRHRLSMPTRNGHRCGSRTRPSCQKTKQFFLRSIENSISTRRLSWGEGIRPENRSQPLIHAIQQVSRGDFYLTRHFTSSDGAYRTKSDRPADPLTVPSDRCCS